MNYQIVVVDVIVIAIATVAPLIGDAITVAVVATFVVVSLLLPYCHAILVFYVTDSTLLVVATRSCT